MSIRFVGTTTYWRTIIVMSPEFNGMLSTAIVSELFHIQLTSPTTSFVNFPRTRYPTVPTFAI